MSPTTISQEIVFVMNIIIEVSFWQRLFLEITFKFATAVIMIIQTTFASMEKFIIS